MVGHCEGAEFYLSGYVTCFPDAKGVIVMKKAGKIAAAVLGVLAVGAGFWYI